MEITVGQKVWLKPMGNAARYSTQIKTDVVSKIARKYFYLETHRIHRFSIENLMDDRGQYSSEWKVYLSETELSDEIEHKDLSVQISKYFSNYNKSSLPLEKLRAISKIINQ